MDSGADQKTCPGSLRDPILPAKLIGVGLITSSFLFVACASGRQPSPNQVREEIQRLGLAHFSTEQIRVQSVSLMGENQAVASVQVQSAFQLSRGKNKDWQVQSVRIGDRNWVDLKAFQEALNLVLAKQTRENLQKLIEGLKKYKEARGTYPEVPDVVQLTDILVPAYMSEVIRYDAWNHQLIYRIIGSDSFQLLSPGADGSLGTSDDIVLAP